MGRHSGRYKLAGFGKPFTLQTSGDGAYLGDLHLYLERSAAGLRVAVRLAFGVEERLSLQSFPAAFQRYEVHLLSGAQEGHWLRRTLGLEKVSLQVRELPCRNDDFQKLVPGYLDNPWLCTPIVECPFRWIGLRINAPTEVRLEQGLVVCGIYGFRNAELRAHGTTFQERIRLIVAPAGDIARRQTFDLDTLRWKSECERSQETPVPGMHISRALIEPPAPDQGFLGRLYRGQTAPAGEAFCAPDSLTPELDEQTHKGWFNVRLGTAEGAPPRTPTDYVVWAEFGPYRTDEARFQLIP
jgi:hypothetical protein